MGRKSKRIEEWKKIESKLQVADIILARETKLLSKIITRVTKSHWSHAMVVFFVPDKKNLFNNVLVISAETHGIEIHRIQKFSKKLINKNYDLGVKRVEGLSDETKEKVLSFMFNNLDIPYDYTRLLAFFIRYLKSIFKKKDKKAEHLTNYLVNKDAFICSSFIQKAFFGAMPKSKKNSVLFKQCEEDKCFLEEITPANLAKSKNSKWIYNPHK